MTAQTQQAADDYRRVSVHAEINDASPHRLIQLLFHRLLVNLRRGAQAIDAGRVAEKGERLGDAIAIIDCLRTSLDFSAANDIAAKLDALYDFAIRELLQANLASDRARVDAVADVLDEIKTAWDEIGDRA